MLVNILMAYLTISYNQISERAAFITSRKRYDFYKSLNTTSLNGALLLPFFFEVPLLMILLLFCCSSRLKKSLIKILNVITHFIFFVIPFFFFALFKILVKAPSFYFKIFRKIKRTYIKKQLFYMILLWLFIGVFLTLILVIFDVINCLNVIMDYTQTPKSDRKKKGKSRSNSIDSDNQNDSNSNRPSQVSSKNEKKANSRNKITSFQNFFMKRNERKSKLLFLKTIKIKPLSENKKLLIYKKNKVKYYMLKKIICFLTIITKLEFEFFSYKQILYLIQSNPFKAIQDLLKQRTMLLIKNQNFNFTQTQQPNKKNSKKKKKKLRKHFSTNKNGYYNNTGILIGALQKHSKSSKKINPKFSNLRFMLDDNYSKSSSKKKVNNQRLLASKIFFTTTRSLPLLKCQKPNANCFFSSTKSSS